MLMSAVYKPRGSFVTNNDFGDVDTTVGFSQEDFTDRYNTELSEDEEAQFQTWAKANNRLGDLYDYDMRGAWKEGATQAENGHFPDTFKKPNHPTFSVESKYSSDGLKGGEWKNVNGKMVFRPGRELSESEATYLKRYFNDRERGVKLDLSGLVRSDAFMRKQFVRSVFANPNEPTLFEGFTETWRAIPSSVLSTVSAGIDAISALPIQYLATTEEAKAWLKGIPDNMNDTAQKIREYRDMNFGVNSYRAGSATQVIHGLIDTLPKAALYASGFGLTAGALAFGSEFGINRMQELKAQGVDTKTAAVAGVASFLGSSIGLRLPPALGPNRIMSAIYGGLTNAGVMGAELGAINWVLKNQNYDSLAKSYQLNMTDTLVATGLGAFMGGAFWRRPLTAAERRNNVYIKHRAELTSQWTKELLGVKNEDGSQKFTQEEAETQARAGANAVASYCNQYGLSPEQFWSKKPDVSFDENGNVSISMENDPAVLQYKQEIETAKTTIGKYFDTVSVRNQNKTKGVAQENLHSENYLPVSDIAKQEAKANGLNIDKIKYHSIDESAFRHTIKRHGTENADSDLMSITKADYEAIPDVVSDPDIVSYGTKTRQGKDAIVYGKKMPDGSLIFVEEVRTGRETLAATSMWKKKPGTLLVDAITESNNLATQRLTSKTIPGTSSKQIIVQKPQSRKVSTFNQSAWHGTRYKFDKFSLEHVGTGEGAQAHGHGLYVALPRKTAEGYRDKLAGGFTADIYSKGTRIDSDLEDYLNEILLPDLFDAANKGKLQELKETIGTLRYKKLSGDKNRIAIVNRMNLGIGIIENNKNISIKKFLETVPESERYTFRVLVDAARTNEKHGNGRRLSINGVKKYLEDIRDSHKNYIDKDKRLGERLYKIDLDSIEIKANNNSYLYHVDIPEDSVMLREGAMFDRQPVAVQSALRSIVEKLRQEFVSEINVITVANKFGELPTSLRNKIRTLVDETSSREIQVRKENDIHVKDDYKVVDLNDDTLLGSIVRGFILTTSGRGDISTLLRSEGIDPLGSEVPNILKKDLDDYTKGRAIYKEISDSLGSEKEASSILNEFGIKGIRYNGMRDGECAVLFDDKAIKILEVLQRIKNGQIAGKYSTDNKIKLTPHANLSTFSHEMGHWYLEQTFDLFASGHQNELLQQDTEILMKALGVKSIDEWNAMSHEAKTKAHETFADWVEQYLSTGKVPDSSMSGVMKRIADWIVGVYHSVLGTDTQKAASDVIAERHEAQFGEKLPPLSDEVKSILDRLYKDQLEPKHRPTNDQTAAARTMLAHRQNELRTNAFAEGGATPAELAETQRQGLVAQQTAIAQMLSGENVDVSTAVSNMALSEGAIGNADSNFGKGFVLGADSDNSTIVVLQNRNRSDSVVSTIQINDIASKPQYGLTSFSRDTTQGAPIVSYGKLPDDAYLGRQDYVVDNGERIPVQYAVMDADALQTSNFATGANNPRYGESVDDTQVVAGNGRVIGLRESYRRGTGKQYQAEMSTDSATHGIKPEVIQGMQSPILVRIMPTEKVSTDFVKRSNRSNVMGMDVLEKARQDAPLIRTRMNEYTFNEDGSPTSETAMKFIRDVGEITELKNLLTDDGRVKDSASKRINAAVFYEAYRSDALTKLFDDPDVNIKRVLNAMTAMAPKVIQIREASKGAINLANSFVEGANAVRTARKDGTLGKDVGEQGGLFSSGAELPFSSVFTQNANSEGAILRMLNPLLDWTNQRIAASNDPLFSTGAIDLADVSKELRRLQNIQRVANGLKELPDVDVESIRGSLEKAQEVAESVKKEVQMKDPTAIAKAQEHAQEALQTKNEIDIEFNDLLTESPNRVISIGDGQNKTVSEIQQEIQSIQEQARADSLAIGEAMVCILRNRGI